MENSVQMERYRVASSDMKQSLSNHELASTLQRAHFESQLSLQNTLCSSPERSYAIQNFLPILKQVNEGCAPNAQILIKTFDGARSDRNGYWPATAKDFQKCAQTVQVSRTCGNSANLFSPYYLSSINREEDSARNAWALMSQIRPGEKAIILYQ